MFYKLLLIISVLFYSLTGLVSSCHSASNIAIHKIYTVLPTQNYALSAPPTDKTSLTDGKFTAGYFWTQKTTLGWQNVRTVEIMIDLGKESSIESIVFSTARGIHAGVNYPAQISAFVGSSKDQFLYVGDVAKDSGNVIGPYQTKKFALNGIAAKGRYVLLLVRPNGPYMFCDEIEVLAGDRVTAKAGTLTLENARIFAERLRRLDVEKEFLTGLIDKVKSSIAFGTVNTRLLTGIQQRIDSLATITAAEGIEADILKLRATLLRGQFSGKRFLLETSNPWTAFSPTAMPDDHPLQSIAMIIPQSGYNHAAFVVTNLSTDSKKISIKSGALPQESPTLIFYQVPFVKSAAMEYVADPLVPIAGSFTLRAGESKMVFLTAHGAHPGTWQSTLKVTLGADVKSLSLKLKVSNVVLPAKLTLNSINWGYLDLNPIRDKKPAAVKDLFAHHVNVVVVPAWHISFTAPETNRDLIRMEEYLRFSKGASKVLYFLNFNEEGLLTVSGKYQFMSDEWKVWFKEFYSRLVKSAARAGFTEDQLYLYPFDEMQGKDIDRFVALAAWARKEIPAIKFYATLERKEALQALPYLDIAQVINRDDMYAKAINSKKEIWIYGATENTKSLSPYSYYRLMSWNAFYYGFKGAGFWNYADTGSGENPGSAWDDFDGKRPDFAVIYEGKNGTIVSSRRWEAWRMGIEDYELLTMYAKAKGQKAALDLARTVLDNPQDTGKADSVRQKIMIELAH